MLIPQTQGFTELVSRSFGAMPSGDLHGDVLAQLDAIESETDFDLFLWSLAYRFKVDSEELLRQMGERWAAEQFQGRDRPARESVSMLRSLDWLISRGGLLKDAPILGMESFRAVVTSRSPNSLRVCCLGARRCCSFLEGAARGLGRLSGESLRYVRQPKSGIEVTILFTRLGAPGA